MNILGCFVIFGAALVLISGENVDRIVGGFDAPEGKFPYQVSIQGHDSFYNKHFCGGSIIGERWILTVSHCLFGKKAEKIKLVVGTTSLSKGGKTYFSDLIVRHEKAMVWKNDIALIRLTENISFDKFVQPILLPEEDFQSYNYPAVFSGWGLNKFDIKYPDRLQQIEMKVISRLRCKVKQPFTTSKHICTLTRLGQGTCLGDVGSPLAADGVLIGLMSYIFPCAVGNPDVFVRVYSYVDWIHKTIQENSVSQPYDPEIMPNNFVKN